jgi:hypothetical protein
MTMAHQYPPGYTDDLAARLVRTAEELHVREIADPAAYLGIAIAVSDLVRDLDEALRHGAPWPERWLVHPGEPELPSDEDRIRDAMTEAREHPGRTITR